MFVSLGLVENAEALLAAGANVNAQNSVRNTSLHLVGTNGTLDEQYAMAVLLVKNKADLNIRNSLGKSAIEVAKNDNSNDQITI